MKKFKFRLQKLLQIKTHYKLECQKELAKAERVRRMEETHLGMLHGRMGQELRDLKSLKLARLEITRLVRSVYYQHRLLTNMVTQGKAIAQAQKTENEKRELLLEAAKEEKIFEKLKERRQERYLKEYEHLQQKDTDEIAKNACMQKKGVQLQTNKKSPRHEQGLSSE